MLLIWLGAVEILKGFHAQRIGHSLVRHLPEVKLSPWSLRPELGQQKGMTDKSLTKSACKKTYIVRTKLVNNDEEYISIVKDILPAVCSINSLVKY